jgi:hypothetical protein
VATRKRKSDNESDAITRSPRPMPVQTSIGDGTPPTTLEALDALLVRLRAMRNCGLEYEEEMASVKEERALLRERSTMEARLRLTESSIVREHPAWMALRDRIVTILARHPAALAEVLATLDEP